MPQLYSVPAGVSVAARAAALMLEQCGVDGLASSIALVPTRRSCVALRDAFSVTLAGRSTLLPRIVALADIADELLTLLGSSMLSVVRTIPPAMGEVERRFLLARYIMAFEKRRMGSVSATYALTLADSLMALQDQVTRAGVVLSQETLRPLMVRDVADHWKQALQFLAILTDHWPVLEQEKSKTTAAAREVRALTLLSEHWRNYPPVQPVYVIGSTASQPATAELMKTIADCANGHVILPGLPPESAEWADITAGHPLFHLKQFLELWPVSPQEVKLLADGKANLWLEALAPIQTLERWKQAILPSYSAISLIPAAHVEEEARVIALIIREGLEQSAQGRIALITPDESLMDRVASHLARDGVVPSRLASRTLAQTEAGSLWISLTHAIAQGASPRAILELIRHPALQLEGDLVLALEKSWRGLNRVESGKMPRHEPTLKSHPQYVVVQNLVHNIKKLSELYTSPNLWFASCQSLLGSIPVTTSEGWEAVEDALESITEADNLGAIDAKDYNNIICEELKAYCRDSGIKSDLRVVMVTPVEARLEQFDVVILASMTEDIWPGGAAVNPWLNQSMQLALGLPSPAEHVSLMAHDVLMHGSAPRVFLTYAARKDGSPIARSRFIERLLVRLAAGGGKEETLIAARYLDLARVREAASEFTPEAPINPKPTGIQRPKRLPVTDIDTIFNDPFTIYAKHVLGLRRLEDVDADPAASDFGSLTHKAIHALTQHWNEKGMAASAEELEAMARQGLREFSGRPNIDLFWRARLLNGLKYINAREQDRRANLVADVASETPVEGEIAGVTLHGRIDRLEEGKGGRVVVDYKTGTAPTTREIADGKALQLLTYAMLIDAADAVEYWQLPRLGEAGEITAAKLEKTGETVEKPSVNLNEIRAKLAKNLEKIRDPSIPFLATPDERFGSDYDGISRYDEWAG